jgi:hypothetical protein
VETTGILIPEVFRQTRTVFPADEKQELSRSRTIRNIKDLLLLPDVPPEQTRKTDLYLHLCITPRA